MAQHTVTFQPPELEIGKADIVFDIDKDGSKFGELRISKGSAVWFPVNTSYGYKLSWSKLSELFQEHGSERAEKR